jgi:hypothetical protein
MGRSSSRSSSSRSNLYGLSASSRSQPTQIQQINHKIEQPGFFSNVMQGFGLGAGQSIAMNLFRSPTEVKHIHDSPTPAPTLSIYDKCIKDGNNKESCTSYTKCMKEYDNTICQQHLTLD